MGRSNKQKMKMKRLQEARLAAQEARRASQAAGEQPREATPSPPQAAGEQPRETTTSPPQAAGEQPREATTSPPQPSTSSKPASRTSLKFENVPSLDFEEKNSRRYQIVDMDSLLQWVRSFARCTCQKKMHVQEDRQVGNAIYLTATCSDCDSKFSMCTSVGGVTRTSEETESCPYDVHNQLVKSTLQSSSGYIGIRELSTCLNTNMLSERRYNSLAKKIYDETIQQLENVMEKTRASVHERLEKQGDKNAVKKIRVSCDGSWSKRGHTSIYGFVSVIEMTTGLVIDFVVLSKWCKICSMSSEEAPPHDCTKNFHGSSPAMEMKGWEMLWARSIEKCKFIYEEVVSDGDSKGFSAVQKLDLYNVTKLECTNHVAKRIGTALRNTRTLKKLGGRKEGSLTDHKIVRLSNYFGKAVKEETTVEDMKNSIYATLKHCMSTDAKPQHRQCPDGRTSWCFFKRAIARNQKIPKHKDKMTTYLRPQVVTEILPLYQRIVTPELLKKCKGLTQNANESLHSVIWNDLPKTKFFTLKRMMYSVYRSVVKFNHGALALSKATGDPSWLASTRIDRKRKLTLDSKEEKKKERKEKKIRKIQEEEEKREAEGETYGAGIAPL